MSFVLQTLIVLAFIAFVYFLWSRRRYYKLWYQMPGPLGWPFIGVGLQMMNPEKFLQYMEYRSKSFKAPFISFMGPKCFLYVNEPVTMELIFNSPQCINKGDFYNFMSSAIGDGLFTSSSPRWNKHRRLINPAFSRPVLNNFIPIFNTEADVLVKKLRTITGPVEIYEILKRSVLEAACQTTMGKKMNFQNDGSARIFESYNGITEVCVRRMLSPWLYPEFIYQHSKLYKVQQKVVKILVDFVENLLHRDQNSNSIRSEEQLNSTNDDEVCISKSKAIFVEQVRKHVQKGEFSWNDVRDEANVIIAATFETTSTALYIVCLCLAMHPEYQEKLYEELVRIFPQSQNNDNDKDTFQISSEELERMTYAEMLINEAMRLFAPVPMVLRRVSADFTLPNGVTLPAGTQVGLDIYNMQRSEEVWGPKAKQFCPELHFGTADSASEEDFTQAQKKEFHPFAFVPFTKGLRMCIGYRYALMLMKIFLAKIFLNFTIRTDAKLSDLIIKGTISLKLREYPLCEIIERK